MPVLETRADSVRTDDRKQHLVATQRADSRQLVLAGPGTGKTETVAKRLRFLLSAGLGPGEILVLSFSRSAVRTLVRRLERFTRDSGDALDDLRHISIRTFDSWTFRVLRQLGYPPRDLLHGSHDRNIASLTDLMVGNRRDEIRGLLERVRHVIVDEFQDLSGVRGGLVQALLELLAPPEDDTVGFTILGDEAQAIFGFALRNQVGDLTGPSTAELIEDIRNRYASCLITTELETNHRAVPGLARLAHRLRRVLRARRSSEQKLAHIRAILGAIPEIGSEISAETLVDLPGESVAILTRTNGEAIRVWQALMGRECAAPPVSVVMSGGSPAVRVPAWIGATLGPMKGTTVTRNQFSRIYSHFYGGPGIARAKALAVPLEERAWAEIARATQAGSAPASVDLVELRSRLSWPDLFPDDEGESGGSVYVMTIHQSKGREFGRVTLLESNSDNHQPATEAEIIEEASVIFVGVTRAGRILRRIPAGDLPPLACWRFDQGTRTRWGWRLPNGWFYMEMGVPCDVSPTSFIDTGIHGSEGAVDSLQEFLALNCADLRGRKVMLCKTQDGQQSGRYVYAIHLQEGDAPGRLLGQTTQTLTFDMLKILDGRYFLPGRIYNLRLTDVVTLGLSGDATAGLASGWTRSGLWLGVNLYGTGDFRPKPRRRSH